MTIAAVTTFPNSCWEIYAKKMVTSFIECWPSDIPLLIQLDDDLLAPEVQRLLRPQDAMATDRLKDHAEFLIRNDGKDSDDYRKQPLRFCHKVFALYRALHALEQEKASGQSIPRYLLWIDADVITERKITQEILQDCFPKEGDAVSYMGRKDWPHSECGWLVFDLENGGNTIIKDMFNYYKSDDIFNQEQWHDSWIFDLVTKNSKKTNLTHNAPGLDVWQYSPMGKWSTHYKGPVAKAKLTGAIGNGAGGNGNSMPFRSPNQSNIQIKTQNSIPSEKIREQIAANQKLIKNWIRPCRPNDEEIVIVSAGPQLIPEDVRKEITEGRRIVAVKHAIEPLKQAGITPWASILLDPRPHVYDFVQDADPAVIWFVASQVDPRVTQHLLDRGCTVWGYHAAVGADENNLTKEQAYAVISGGTATATRGMHVLNHLGFSRFRLYGYDLCIPDKPDLNARDERGQPKYLEVSIAFNAPNMNFKKCFWMEPQFIAQFEEINEILKLEKWELEAFGDGIVPFVVKSKKVANLRNMELADKIMGRKYLNYKELLGCQSTISLSRRSLKWFRKALHKLKGGRPSYSI